MLEAVQSNFSSDEWRNHLSNAWNFHGTWWYWYIYLYVQSWKDWFSKHHFLASCYLSVFFNFRFFRSSALYLPRLVGKQPWTPCASPGRWRTSFPSMRRLVPWPMPENGSKRSSIAVVLFFFAFGKRMLKTDYGCYGVASKQKRSKEV